MVALSSRVWSPRRLSPAAVLRKPFGTETPFARQNTIHVHVGEAHHPIIRRKASSESCCRWTNKNSRLPVMGRDIDIAPCSCGSNNDRHRHTAFMLGHGCTDLRMCAATGGRDCHRNRSCCRMIHVASTSGTPLSPGFDAYTHRPLRFRIHFQDWLC